MASGRSAVGLVWCATLRLLHCVFRPSRWKKTHLLYNARVPSAREAHEDGTSLGRARRPARVWKPTTRSVANYALVAVVLTVALLLAACGGGDDARETVHGQLTDVQTRTFTEIGAFSLRDDAGKTWLFTTDGPLGLTPSHLRQHMLSGEEVTVEYERRARGLVAVSIADYP